MSTRDYEGGAYMELPTGSGWVIFASIMLAIAGVWNVIQGFLAIAEADIVSGRQDFIFSNVKTWGWIILFIGVLQVIAAFSLWKGSEIARWFGIATAAVGAIGQLAYAPAYPLWAVCLFAIDILVIYGLAVYAGSRLKKF
jgi:hypothetical protein